MSENASLNAAIRSRAGRAVTSGADNPPASTDVAQAYWDLVAAQASGDELRIDFAERVMDEADRRRREARKNGEEGAEVVRPDFGAGARGQGVTSEPSMSRLLRAAHLGIPESQLPREQGDPPDAA